MFSAGSDLLCAGCCLSPHQQKNIVQAEPVLGSESDACRCVVLCILKNMNLSLTMPNNPQKTVHMFLFSEHALFCKVMTQCNLYAIVFVASVFLK